MAVCPKWTCLALLCLQILHCTNAQIYSIIAQTPADCKRAASDPSHEYFDVSQLQCRPCAQDAQYQTVSADGLSCVCQKGMRYLVNVGGPQIQCQPCETNQVTSADGWNCVACGSDNQFNPATNECQPCAEGSIGVERYLNGTWNVVGVTRTKQCRSCKTNTHPNIKGDRCERCNQILSVGGPASCQCDPERLTGGLCFRSAQDLVAETTSLYTITYVDGSSTTSEYFNQHIRAASGMCNTTYNNLTACQVLGNMCVLTMYSQKGSNLAQDACSLYSQIMERRNTQTGQNSNSTGSPESAGRPVNMPWLYYTGTTADRIITDPAITTRFTFPNSRLQLRAARYTLNGTYLGLQDVQGGHLQLCQAPQASLDAAFSFGTSYSQECEINAKDFWDKYETIFHDLFMEYTTADGTGKRLYAIPVLLNNYRDAGDAFVNRGADMQSWRLVRRFFLVDNVSGRPASSTSGSTGSGGSGNTATTTSQRASYVRYPQSITIYVNLQQGTGDGKIYPPYIRIQHGVLKASDYDANTKVKVSFNVEYNMNLDKYNNDMAIAVGVLSGLAIVYAGLLTWGWNKRAGKIAIDFVTLVKFVLFVCGSLANVFFVVAFGSAVWWIIFYKRQTAVYLLLPNFTQETNFVAYLGAAFTLKFIQVLHMIIAQVTVDIFFIDWERPRGSVLQSGGDGGQKPQEAPVSIWRTYFVANEWNEIQTTRKINQIFQIFAVIFFLSVIGFENFATRDPFSNFSFATDQYRAPDSRILRFAMGTAVYILVAVVQWAFYTFFYERFIEDKVRQYVDLCSMSNVSVFILENNQFGYYIHGRSVHGRADTGMREMHENLKREEEDLCGQRGLLAGSEQQTFQMAVPRKLRNQYDKVLMPLTQPQTGAGQNAPVPRSDKGGTSHIDPQTEKSIQAYGIINRFLQAFIDHSLRDLDYMVKDKLLFESILNVEFQDASEKGLFFNDDGHSFDAVLFFGNEMTLLLFEVLFFGIVDLLAQNFILAAVLTYIIMEIITMLRDSLGRKNLAKKTLVDERFLI